MVSASGRGLEKGVHAFFQVQFLAIEDEIRLHRFLEGTVPAGEVLDFALGGLGIEAFDIAGGAGFVASPDINLEKISAENAAGDIAEFAARGDGGDDRDDALGGEKPGDLGDAADVFEAVIVREAKVRVEAGAHVIAIEDDRGAALLVQHALGGIGDGGFSGA